MSTEVLQPKKVDFESIIKQDTLVFAEFFATWCSACKSFDNTIEKISQQYGNKLTILKIDVDDYKELSNKYDIKSVPTVIFFKKGQALWRESGAMPFNWYAKLINENI